MIVDVSESRLALATSLGVDKAFLIDPKQSDVNEIANQIKKEFGAEADLTLECAGVESSIQVSI